MSDREDPTYEEIVAALPDELFRSWTDPGELKHWFGPGGFRTIEASVDLRVGGAYRLVMRAPDGTDLVITGTYDVIEPDRRLVYTWIWAHAPTEVMRVHVDFEPVAADRTRIVIRHTEITDGELRRYESGWREGVARLRQLVKS